MTPIRIMQCTLIERLQVSRDVVEIRLRVPEKPLRFLAGHYARLTLMELSHEDPRGNWRDFSISSSAADADTIAFAFRMSESGFKRTLAAMPLGAAVKVTGPFGAFTLPADTDRAVAYIAGGIGITPFMSHLRTAASLRLPQTMHILYGNEPDAGVPFKDELERMKRDAKGRTVEYVSGGISKDHLSGIAARMTPLWYVSGSPQMVESTVRMLGSIGVEDADVKTESFLGYSPGTDAASRAAVTRAARKERVYSDGASVGYMRTRAIMDALNMTAIVSEDDIEGTITFVNDKFVEISQYSREDVIGQNHRILKSGHHDPAFYRTMWETISQGKVWHGEMKNRAKDGTHYWVDTSIAPIKNDQGDVIRYISVRFPITEQKLYEGRLEDHAKGLEDTVAQRTGEYRDKIAELERLTRLLVGRELKMAELKAELRRYKKQKHKNKKKPRMVMNDRVPKKPVWPVTSSTVL